MDAKLRSKLVDAVEVALTRWEDAKTWDENLRKTQATESVTLSGFVHKTVGQLIKNKRDIKAIHVALFGDKIDQILTELTRAAARAEADKRQLSLFEGFDRKLLPRRVRSASGTLDLDKATVGEYRQHVARYEQRTKRDQAKIDELRRLAVRIARFDDAMTMAEAMGKQMHLVEIAERA